MANLDRAHEHAQKISSRKAASRLYNDIEYELAMGEPNTDQERKGELALAELDQRFDGIRRDARDVEEPPNLSRTAWKRTRGEHAPLGARTPSQHKAERKQPNRTARQRISTATAIHAWPRPRRTSSRLFSQTGIPAAVESGTQLLMRMLGGLAGLSFLFLLLTPRGSKAVSVTSSGLTHSLAALVSPTVDPLRSTTAAQAAAAKAIAAPGFASQAGNAGVQAANAAAAAIGAAAASVGTGAHKPTARTGAPAHGGTFK